MADSSGDIAGSESTYVLDALFGNEVDELDSRTATELVSDIMPTCN